MGPMLASRGGASPSTCKNISCTGLANYESHQCHKHVIFGSYYGVFTDTNCLPTTLFYKDIAMIKRLLVNVSAGLALSGAALAAHAVDVTGAGASFPYPAYAKWAAQCHEETGK